MPSSKQPRILIVDDDASALSVLAGRLTEAGYEVLQASDGAAAMRILLKDGPRIVITDWTMPEMDGLELCRAIRSHEGIGFAYVIVVAARQTSEQQLVAAFDAGADDYLCKPYNPSELLARICAGERIVCLQENLDSRTREAHLFNAEMAVAQEELSSANRRLHQMATTDELTGLINRRDMLRRLTASWISSERNGHPLSVVSLDIDHFKRCNDAYGHAVGDTILRQTARMLRRSARREELVARVGGEEFLLLCPHATESMAAVAAERLRRDVESNVIQSGTLTIRITISLGVAQRSEGMTSPEDLLRGADEALYAAKAAGRNTVCTASQAESSDADPLGDIGGRGRFDSQGSQQPDDPAHILVVDSDREVRQFCAEQLKSQGHRTRGAADLADALRKMEHLPPDVVILGDTAGSQNHTEVVRQLKTGLDGHTIPLILMGSGPDAEDVVHGLEAGADELLTKPLHRSELVLRVETMIRLGRGLARSNAVRGEQSRALSLLLDFSHDIAAADSLDGVLERVIAVSAALTGCRSASIMLPEPDGATLICAKSLGIDEARTAEVRVLVGAPTSGAVFLSREPVVVGSVAEARRHGDTQDALLLSGIPHVSIPLCAPEHVVGVLNLTGRPKARPFTPTELDYLDLISNIAAAAIDERLTRRSRDDARHSIVVALANLAEHRDSDTGKHLDRVARFSCILAQQLRDRGSNTAVITDQFIRDLERAVPLHDIGKVAIPDSILLKPGRLTAEETTVMRTHAAIGANTIRSIIEREPGVPFLIMAEEIARAHHEWHDGGGYPRGLEGEAIPLTARIVAVADVYDAVTTRRPYKEPMSHEQAVEIITNSSGKQFDPHVVEAFVDRTAEFERLAAELADEMPDEDDPTTASTSVPALAGA